MEVNDSMGLPSRGHFSRKNATPNSIVRHWALNVKMKLLCKTLGFKCENDCWVLKITLFAYLFHGPFSMFSFIIRTEIVFSLRENMVLSRYNSSSLC